MEDVTAFTQRGFEIDGEVPLVAEPLCFKVGHNLRNVAHILTLSTTEQKYKIKMRLNFA